MKQKEGGGMLQGQMLKLSGLATDGMKFFKIGKSGSGSAVKVLWKCPNQDRRMCVQLTHNLRGVVLPVNVVRQYGGTLSTSRQYN